VPEDEREPKRPMDHQPLTTKGVFGGPGGRALINTTMRLLTGVAPPPTNVTPPKGSSCIRNFMATSIRQTRVQ